MNPKNALLLIGSPKGRRSASNNIASYLEERFKQNNMETEKIYLVEHQKPDRMKKLVDKATEPELMILIAPLYIDSVPAITINFMEEFHLHKNSLPDNGQKLLTIFNSGFPEPKHNDLAIDMCRIFAHQTGIKWAGGVTIGMGAAFESRPLDNAGSMARNLRKGLDEIVDSLSQNKPVRHEALHTASKPLMPLFLAKFAMHRFGGRMWKSRVKDKNIQKEMYKRPYET